MAKKILTVAGTAAGGLIGGTAASFIGKALFGKKKKKTPAPTTDTPTVMPLPDDEAVQRAKKEAQLRARARGGRSSTILTGSDDVLGGY